MAKKAGRTATRAKKVKDLAPKAREVKGGKVPTRHQANIKFGDLS